jgi:hypothetical protein
VPKRQAPSRGPKKQDRLRLCETISVFLGGRGWPRGEGLAPKRLAVSVAEHPCAKDRNRQAETRSGSVPEGHRAWSRGGMRPGLPMENRAAVKNLVGGIVKSVLGPLFELDAYSMIDSLHSAKITCTLQQRSSSEQMGVPAACHIPEG